jgi:diaminopimelate epimerase
MWPSALKHAQGVAWRPFAKMQALGNDFVIVPALQEPFVTSPEMIGHLADRRLGVGCDQLLVLEPSPNDQADFRCRIFNADGSASGQCGNGMRCLAALVFSVGWQQGDVVRFVVDGRLILCRRDDSGVAVGMGPVSFEAEAVGFRDTRAACWPRLDVAGHPAVALSLGNPHLVVFVPNIRDPAIETWAHQLAQDPRFADGINVGFCHAGAQDALELRVFERGVGETPACGSGATAACLAWRHLKGHHELERCRIQMPGGMLMVQLDQDGPWLQGPTEVDFWGVFAEGDSAMS